MAIRITEHGVEIDDNPLDGPVATGAEPAAEADPASMTEAQRAILGVQLTDRRGADPITTRRAADKLGVSDAMISRARVIYTKGTPALLAAVEDGSVTVATGCRLAAALPFDQQDWFVQQVRDGANAARLGAQLVAPATSEWRQRQRQQDGEPGHVSHFSSRRHRHISVTALRSLRDSLDALALVVRNTDGLDPAITDEEAAQWVDDLSKGRGALRRVLNLLNDRKESNP